MKILGGVDYQLLVAQKVGRPLWFLLGDDGDMNSEALYIPILGCY